MLQLFTCKLQLFTYMLQLFTYMLQLFTGLFQICTCMLQLLTCMLQLFTYMLQLFTGLLQLTTDGTLLKPVQSPPRGEREANFYTQVFDLQCTDPVLLGLQPLLPLYLGSWSSPQQPTGQCSFLNIVLLHIQGQHDVSVRTAGFLLFGWREDPKQ